MAFFLNMVAQSIRRRVGRFKITLTAIALAAAAYVLATAMLNGVASTMIRNAVSIQAGHVQADWPARQRHDPGLIAACESIPSVRLALMRSRGIGILTNDHDCYALATLYGVDPAREGRQTLIAPKIVEGRYLAGPGEIVIGQGMAEMLHARAGQTVTFRPSASAARTYRVCGVFRTGLSEMDRFLAYTADQESADSREVSLFLDAEDQTPAVASRLKALIPAEGQVRQWGETMPDLVQLLALNRAAMSIVVVLVMAILALGVSNTLYVSVGERTRELGILKAMGMSPGDIMLLVLAETGLLVGAGALGGAALGAGLAAACSWGGGVDLSRWTSMNPLWAGSGVVDPHLTAAAVVLPLVVIVSCGLLAGLLPARRAGRISVTAALRSL